MPDKSVLGVSLAGSSAQFGHRFQFIRRPQLQDWGGNDSSSAWLAGFPDSDIGPLVQQCLYVVHSDSSFDISCSI